jgi:hypothetical protein
MRSTILLTLLLFSSNAFAGAAAGPAARTNTVQGFHTMTFTMRFAPGRPAVVTVQGDGDTPLELVVLDARGKRVAADAKNGDRPSVRWTPAGAEPYRVKVINRGGVPNRISLRTN